MTLEDLAQLRVAGHWRDPIVIVGVGPIGMITALGLARYNVPCLLLDDDAGPALEGSRAFLIDQHTLEILGSWSNLAQQITEQGIILTGERIFVRKSALYSTPIPPPQPGIRYPSFVNIQQCLLEHLLFTALKTVPGCHVLWQHKVIGIDQDSYGVNVEVMAPDGVKYLRAPYILATDGSQSAVRDLLKITNPVASRDYHMLMLDVRIDGAEPPHERYLWFDPPFNPGRIAQLNPLPGNIYRLDYQLSPSEDLVAISQPVALHERVVATIGRRPYRLVWMSTYTYQQQVMEQFIHGRVLFLGDAARVISPFGCNGLNCGVQDAWNLVWKFVQVRAGLAHEALLDTYQNERHAVADETMRFLEPPSNVVHWKRNTNLRLRQPFKSLRKQLLVDQLANSFNYSDSPVTSDDHRLYLGGRFTKLPFEQNAVLQRFRQGPVVGSLAPSIMLLDADMDIPVSLSEHFGRGFVALCFCADVEMGMSVLQRLKDNLTSIPVELCLISQSLPATAVDSIQVFLDAGGKAANIYNAGPRTLYLVRPDGYICARRFDSDFNDISALLRHAVGEDRVDTQTRLRTLAGSQESQTIDNAQSVVYTDVASNTW